MQDADPACPIAEKRHLSARERNCFPEAAENRPFCVTLFSQRLERAEERLFALRGLARKHRVDVEALPALAADFAARLEALDGGEARLGALEAEAREAEAAWRACAMRLRAARASWPSPSLTNSSRRHAR